MTTETINRKDFITTKWSGGETTQIFIYPENGNYEKREFKIRISSALIKNDKSVFTRLEGVKRWIMPLEGEMKLIHNNTGIVVLKSYDVDAFSGEDVTICEGMGIDFNLMIKGNYEGELYTIDFSKKINTFVLENAKFYIFYAYEDRFDLNGYTIDRDNVVVLSNVFKNIKVDISGTGKFIVVKIN